MTRILAAGAVLWRPAGAEIEVALVHRPRYDDWSLPKGKLEPGETPWAAAVREVAEETGFSAVLGRYLTQIAYPVTRPVPAIKTVDYLAARARSGRFRPSREVDDLRWLPVADAANLLTYPHDHDVLRAFTALPPDTVSLLLVRHAKAGKRAAWPGHDDDRPLSGNGRQQARALRSLLALFGADRVHSAPLVRCVQTVQQLADDLGARVAAEPLVSEQGYRGHEEVAVARLCELAAAGGTPVVCSQGGVIPDLLSRLATSSGLPLDCLESRKGSVWLLSFTRAPGPRLAAAHYVPKP